MSTFQSVGFAMTFLQVGSCGSALLHDTSFVSDGHSFCVDPFVFHTHTSLAFCGATTYEGSMIVTFFCLGIHI